MRAFEQQPRESDIAFAVYKVYRDLGPGRTLREAAAIYYDKPVYREYTTSVPAQVKRWSAKFDWPGRAREADARDDQIRREAIELHDLKRMADHTKRVEALREKNLENEELAAALEAEYLDRAEKLLDELPLVQKTVVREEDGKPVAYLLQPATKNAVLDAVRLHKIATRSEPKTLGMPNINLDNVTDEQLDRIIAGEDPWRVLGESS